jgi:predicted phage replisome organizer
MISMAKVEWIKTRVDLFEDEKIKLIESLPEGDTLLIIWMKLLAHAGKVNDGGYIYLKEGTPYTEQMLSIVYNRELSVIESALNIFSDFGMIERDEKGIYIVNWEKHQNMEGLEKIRKQTNERVKKHREHKKQQGKTVHIPLKEESNATCNVTVTHGNATDKEEEREKEIKDKDQPVSRSTSYTESFEQFWSIYPKKVGKQRAFSSWQQRTKETTPNELITAAQNYAKHCKSKGIAPDYIKHPNTFLSPKKDYLDWLEAPKQDNITPFPIRNTRENELEQQRIHQRNKEIAANQFWNAGFKLGEHGHLFEPWFQNGAYEEELEQLKRDFLKQDCG